VFGDHISGRLDFRPQSRARYGKHRNSSTALQAFTRPHSEASWSSLPFRHTCTTALAPIIMISSNQINAIVRSRWQRADASPPVVTVQVVNGSPQRSLSRHGDSGGPWNVHVWRARPGAGRRPELRQTSGSYTINSSKTGAPLGSTYLSTAPDWAISSAPWSMARWHRRGQVSDPPCVWIWTASLPWSLCRHIGRLRRGLVKLTPLCRRRCEAPPASAWPSRSGR